MMARLAAHTGSAERCPPSSVQSSSRPRGLRPHGASPDEDRPTKATTSVNSLLQFLFTLHVAFRRRFVVNRHLMLCPGRAICCPRT